MFYLNNHLMYFKPQPDVLKRRAWIVRNFLGSQTQNRPEIKKDTAFCLERPATVNLLTRISKMFSGETWSLLKYLSNSVSSVVKLAPNVHFVYRVCAQTPGMCVFALPVLKSLRSSSARWSGGPPDMSSACVTVLMSTTIA